MDLIEGLMHDRGIAPAFRDRIVHAAEGNPLFVEQMLAMLSDDPDAAVEAVPATIQALLAARIDRLEPAERAVLQRASVEGRLFHRGAVAELLPSPGPDGLGGVLLALTRKEMVRPDRSLYEGDDGFRFNHMLIRDVAYASMPKELRADLHAQLATWLEAQTGARLTGLEEIVGYHYERAYLIRVELGRFSLEARADALKGGHLLGRAGRRVLDRGEFAAAAAQLGARMPAPCGRARRTHVVAPRSRPGASRHRLARGRRRRPCRGDRDREALQRRGDASTEPRWSEHTSRSCGRRRTPRRCTTLRVGRSPCSNRSGATQISRTPGSSWASPNSPDATEERNSSRSKRVVQYAIASGDTRRQIEAWNEVGGAMLFGRTPVDEVLGFLDEELAWARERGLAAVEADALLGGPYLYARLGRFEEARDRLERSKSICRELGIAYGLAEAHSAGASMEMLAGDADAAERELHDAIDVATDMGASRYIALYRTQLARVLLEQGRNEDAAAELEQARDIYNGDPAWKVAEALLLARRGETEEAVALAREALASMADSDNITAHAEVLVDVAEVLRAHGDLVGAADSLAAAVVLHDEKGNVLAARRCRQLLAAIAAGGPAARHR